MVQYWFFYKMSRNQMNLFQAVTLLCSLWT